jgi:DHA2 family multidrug resistance protein
MSTAALQARPERDRPGSASPSVPGAAPALVRAEDEPSYQYRWIILVGLLLASIMEVLDTTIINVSLPQMAGNLGATTTEIAWVSTSYILANVVILPMTAFLSSTFGRRRYLSFSILMFIASSFFCGTSHSLGELVFWRILQGAGGAALLSTAQATLRQIFPLSQQGIVQALFLLGIIVAPTVGPTLGGWITDNYTWSWIFFINIPIGLLAFFLVATYLTDSPYQTKPQGIDWLGIFLLTVGLACLQYVLEEGNQDDWFESRTIVTLSVISGIALTSLIIWLLAPENKNPVVNLKILHNRDLAASLLLFVTLGFGLYGGVFLFPLFAQQILRFTPTETGLALLPGGIATGVATLTCGRLLNGTNVRIDPRALIIFGVSVFAVAMWMLGHLTTQSGIPDTAFALIIRGFALGFLFTPINLAAFGSLKPQEVPQASGLLNLTRQLGGSFGIAVLGTYITNQTVFHKSILSEYIYSGNPAVLERQQALQGLMISKGYTAAQAAGGWLGLLNQQVSRQAAAMSFNDGFLLILIAFLCATPMVFLLRRPKRAGAAAGGDAH